MTASETTPPSAARFDIQRLYVREQSCKIPHAPAIFQGEWKPEIQLEMNVKPEKVADSGYEVILTLTVTAKNAQRTAFLLEVQQAGTFVLEQFTPEQQDLLLHVHCPTILYPYARKVIADAVTAAGFPTLTLVPINFEALYYQQQQGKEAQQTSAGMAATPPIVEMSGALVN